MKKYYAKVTTQFETVTLVIKHKTVDTIEAAKQRLFDEYNFTTDQVLSIATTPPVGKTTYSEEVYSLFAYLDKLSRIKDVKGYLGSL